MPSPWLVVLILVLVSQGILALWLVRLAARIARLEWDRFGHLAKHAGSFEEARYEPLEERQEGKKSSSRKD
jgi:hypothetical protein